MTGARMIATLGGIGLLRPAPGTWGAAAALPLAWALHLLGGPWLLIAVTGIAALAGVRAIPRAVGPGEDPDRPEFVIDELAGQWIALWPVSLGAWGTGADVLALWPGIVAAFVLFRLFDIAKPGPVDRADRRKDAVGVMLDDVIAGLFAAVGVVILAAIGHGVMLL
ncbi:phosphatidylglycerophosphatase A family protein [Roseovarius salinarum]|uniref:phosphatidylglycerophosphatase A family protein n=1 Tax=Roseovarius salinarum TaxID=1981892 RepID=UPI000C31D165|nr:phosphatidylglycerophosphatase A [Roseovarius salinarum]